MTSNDFTRFVGRLVFSPERCGWETLSPEEQQAYCKEASRHRMGPLFARFLKGSLPEKYEASFQEQFLRESVKALMEEHHWAETTALWRQQGFEYMPIKGADLAFRVYPDPALRYHGDWDVLFPKKMCPAVMSYLLSHGWCTFSGLVPDVNEAPCHHYDRLHDSHQALEVHWILPHFGSATHEEVWQNSIRREDGSWHLTPEMNLLLLSAHASGEEFAHLTPWRILLDAGYILKHDPVDWDKIHELADRWGLLRPDILLATWIEFFPEGMIPAEAIVPETQKLLRETFDMHAMLSRASSDSKASAKGKQEGFTAGWFLKKVSNNFSVHRICTNYHLKPRQHVRIVLYGIADLCTKAWAVCRQICRPDRELNRYYDHAAQIRKLSKKP